MSPIVPVLPSLPPSHHSPSRVVYDQGKPPPELHSPGDSFPLSQRSPRTVEQPRWAKWAANHSSKSRRPGTQGHTVAARGTGALAASKWINYRTKPSASWLNSSHDTHEIQESMKIGHYYNKVNKIWYLLHVLFRICEIFNHNSGRQFNPVLQYTQRHSGNSTISKSQLSKDPSKSRI